ncbi:MAG TPA: hypothetical protein ENG59_04415 [Chloroflexi bacterium]|nr:MAG: hypothetical protein DRI46_02160 [Chloroflexota bacterium]HDD55465.1 hypothetical protein [Chloroflexota bacterium]
MNEEKTYARVVLTNIDIPFGSLVTLLIKVSLASIPAAIILSLLGLVIAVLISFVFSSIGLGLLY